MLDDKKIREILLDAEVKAPRRIWPSVSSRLDAPAGGKVHGAVWKWAGAAAAFAAAVVVGVFIIGGGREVIEVTGEPLVAETSADVTEMEQVREERSVEVAEPVRIVPAKRENPVLLAMADNVPDVEETVKTADEPVNCEQSEVAVPEERPSPEVGDEEISAGDGAVLDRMEKEDELVRPERRADIIIGGTLSGNTASKSFRATMSGGVEAIPSSDVIKETGASDFGVPFTVGLGFRCYLAPKFSMGSGIDYSLLTRTFAGTFTAAASTTSVPGNVRNTMHYIGIPINLYYDIIDSRAIDLYVYGGGEAEYCISNKYVLHSAMETPGDYTVRQKVRGIQFSAKLGIGVQFSLSDRVGLYLDPGVSYYFYGGQPRSIRAERPLMFNLNAGLRFDLRKK